MALTRITKGVIKPNENYDTHNIVSTGIVTSVGLDVNGSADISGSLSVGGVLTYEDVTSIDSVGLITARSGIVVSGFGTDNSIRVGDNNFYAFSDDNVSTKGSPTFRNLNNNANTVLRIIPNGTGTSQFEFFANDYYSNTTSWKNLRILADPSNDYISVNTAAASTVSGSSKHLVFETEYINNGTVRSNPNQLFLKNDGKVGIGTSNPDTLLHLLGGSGNNKLITLGGGATPRDNYIGLFDSDNLEIAADEGNAGGNSSIRFRIDGDEKVRILHGGGVGISTTILPYGNFAVDHGQYGLTRISNHSHLLLQNKNAGTTDFWSVAPRDNARIGISRGTPDANGTVHERDEKLTILSDGKTGIGTHVPAYGFDVRVDSFVKAQFKGKGVNETNIPFYIMSGNSAVQLGIEPAGGQEKIILQANDDSMRFHTASEERLRINNVGHVAIGTDSPNASLPLTIQGQYPGIQFRDNEGTAAFNINADANEFRIQTGHAGGSPTPRLVLKSDGRIEVTGDGHRNSSYGIFQVNQAADNDEGGIAILNDANSRSMRIYVDASGNSVINSGDGGAAPLILNEGNGDVIVGKNLLPDADNDQDLGSSSKRWANIYTADLQLSNKGNTNDVDGTWGQYTIQEGEDDLFLINKRNGKKYKFMLEEVN